MVPPISEHEFLEESKQIRDAFMKQLRREGISIVSSW